MSESICDFCSSPDVQWSYPARDFSGRHDYGPISVEQFSAGGWAACDPCHDLIQRGDREALAERSVERFRKLHGGFISKAILMREIRKIHDNFWQNREGAPTHD